MTFESGILVTGPSGYPILNGFFTYYFCNRRQTDEYD